MTTEFTLSRYGFADPEGHDPIGMFAALIDTATPVAPAAGESDRVPLRTHGSPGDAGDDFVHAFTIPPIFVDPTSGQATLEVAIVDALGATTLVEQVISTNPYVGAELKAVSSAVQTIGKLQSCFAKALKKSQAPDTTKCAEKVQKKIDAIAAKSPGIPISVDADALIAAASHTSSSALIAQTTNRDLNP